MQWSPAPGAGFTTGEPWLPIAEDYREVNVEAQRADPRSMLSLYRRLIDLRRGEPALEVGRYLGVEAEGDVLAYLRRARGGESGFLVVLNLGPRAHVFHVPDDIGVGTVALSTHLDREGEPVGRAVRLRPDEGVVIRLQAGLEGDPASG